jgi:ABC-type multidrug transport system fused ATPase/permease subunit
MVPLSYQLAAVLVLSYVLTQLMIPRVAKCSGDEEDKASKKALSVPRRLEAESWQRGVFSWIFVDWVGEWTTLWGRTTNPEDTRIIASELGAHADPEDECGPCHHRLALLWEQEVDRVGLSKANLVSVIARFIGQRKVMMVAMWTALYEASMYLGPPLAVAWIVRYVEWLYGIHMQHGSMGAAISLAGSLKAFVIFSGLPILMGSANTVSTMMSARLGVQVCGGLSCLAFEKAQRLPLNCLAGGGSARDGSFSGLEISEERQRQEEACEDQPQKERAELPKFSLVQLIETDISTNIVQLPLLLVRVVVTATVVVILFCWLFSLIFSTIFVCLLACVFVGTIIAYFARAQLTWMMAFYSHAGQRIQLWEDILLKIGTIKALGWEGLAEKRVAELRKAELSALKGYYWNLGWMHCWFYQLPRIVVFISFWGYEWLYDRQRPANIFITLPVIFTFQSAVMQLMYTLPQLLAAKPSLHRVECFLKEPEAPNAWPRAEIAPRWLSVWPRLDSMALVPVTPKLRVQGSFTWKPEASPVLRDLDLDFPKGSKVAIVGGIGSGKTTPLHAMLGELHPVDDAEVSVPVRIAYAAQVPHLFDGTVKENILNGDTFNAERFATSLHATGLQCDLEMLPRGSETRFSIYGGPLSSGQRSRVALARTAYCIGAELMLLDDPFATVDSQMTKHLLEHLVNGPQMVHRTIVVTCQADETLLRSFDFIVVMDNGGVATQGTPQEVFNNTEFQRLASEIPKVPDRILEKASEEEASSKVHHAKTMQPEENMSSLPGSADCPLHEAEFQGRADWSTLGYVGSLGGWRNLTSSLLCFLAMSMCNFMTFVVLQKWSSVLVLSRASGSQAAPTANAFLPPYAVGGFVAYYFGGYVGCAACSSQCVFLQRCIDKQLGVSYMHRWIISSTVYLLAVS